jgi:hypothetical protein
LPTASEIFYGRQAYRVREGDRPYLEKLTLAAADIETSRNKLAHPIKTAHQADLPLRAIAAAANVSHEQVRRIIRRVDT